MPLYIFKINEKNEIEKSKDLSNIENYKNDKEIFRSSLLTKYFNVIDKNNYYFVIHDDEDLLEQINYFKNNKPPRNKLITLLPNKKPELFFFDEGLKKVMKLKKDIKEYNLNFQKFEENKSFRIIKKQRFYNVVIKSKWITLNAAKIIKEKIEKNNINNKNGRNIESCYIESFSKRMKNIYKLKNRDESYYVLRESELDKEIENRINNKLIMRSEKQDKIINFNKVKSDFLCHIFKNIKIKTNFKTLHKEKWGEKILFIETVIKEFNKDMFSIKEQQALINRIFPSMIYQENNKIFINEQRIKKNISNYLIKNYKFNIIISIIKKSKDIGIMPEIIHYKMLDEALHNHNLKEIERNNKNKKIA
jgi:hypothetical protein